MSPQDSPVVVSPTATPLDIRGRFLTAVVVRVNGRPDERFYEALDTLLRQTPQFFVNAPLILDLERAEGLETAADFMALARELRGRALSPIGVQNAATRQGAAAAKAGLVALPVGRETTLDRRTGAAEAPAAAPEPARAPSDAPSGSPVPALLVTEPVRSGQVIFAEKGDLVVVAQVSSGAELIAHGNIHVYGALRGRALAGVNGDRTARIFCQSLEADLIAIAGLYRTSEGIGPEIRKKRVQAFLLDNALLIEPLK